jgi:type IV pilus assembly protein PilC
MTTSNWWEQAVAEATNRRSDDRTYAKAMSPSAKDEYALGRDDDEPGSAPKDEPGLFPRRVKKREILDLTTQLSLMLDTGITLSHALEGIAVQCENPTLRKTLNEVKSVVQGGDSFSAGLSKFPKQFPATYIALVQSSEQTGTLPETLTRLAESMGRQMDHAAKLRAALAYPVIMSVLAFGETLFLLTYVLPQFKPLFERRGDKLPLVTRILSAMSDSLINYWWAWLLGIAASAALFWWWRKTPQGARTLAWLAINGPLWGPICKKTVLSRSISTLGTMLASGCSMLDALRMTSQVSGNALFAEAWLATLDQITGGSSMQRAMRREKLFPSTLVQMVDAGEETGKLDSVLLRVSHEYDKEVEQQLKAVSSVLEPLLITAMGVVIGVIAMALMLPIFSLSRPN